ncbi:MAG: LCP family protein [Anaerolineales bacterium]|nr:LCP family protein [Anaerolineales bacterium]
MGGGWVGRVVAVAGAAAFVDRRLDQVERVRVAGLGDAGADEPRTVLFVGVDTDERPEADPARAAGARSDTLVLARVDPGAHVVDLLPVPRDLLVDLPGAGRDRINTAIDRGGPDLLVATIGEALGIEVDHYLQTDFAGAVAIGDAVGGVSLAFDVPVRDAQAGLDVAAGCQPYDGERLLALGRSRHLSTFEDGAWHRRDLTSDRGRIERQQVIATAMLAELNALEATDPAEAARVLDAVAEHLAVDVETTNQDLVDLARAMSGAEVRSARLGPVEVYDEGKAVLALTDQDRTVLESFAVGEGPGISEPLPPSGWADHARQPVVPEPC